MTALKLRFGILCRGTTFPAWQAECVRALITAGEAEPHLVIVDSRSADRHSARRSRATITGAPSLLYRRLWLGRRSRAMRPVDLSADLANVAKLCGRQSLSEADFTTDEIEAIGNRELDFILNFSGGPCADGVLRAAAKYGIWCFQHGDEETDHASLPFLREVIERQPVSRTALLAFVSDTSEALVLFEGYFRTRHSYVRQVDTCYLGTARWCVLACTGLRLGRIAKRSVVPAADNAEGTSYPSNLRLLGFMLRQPFRLSASILKKLFFIDQWNVALVHCGVEDLVRARGSCRFEWLKSSSLYDFYADPFALSFGGILHVLVEAFDYVQGRGRIAQVSFPDTIMPHRFPAGIDTGSHMSYPYLVVFRGEILCVPETSAAGDVRLYRAVQFPDRWELAATLIKDFPAVDSTVFEHDGMWWLLCGRRGNLSEVELYAWYAISPWGPWTPHPLNPVKCDIRSSRPAGRPFMIAGSLCRPAQDCSRTYGGAIAINRIVRLTPTAFDEELIGRIEPDPTGHYRHGLHTVCPIDGLTLVDGKRTRFHVAAPALKVWAAMASRWRSTVVAD